MGTIRLAYRQYAGGNAYEVLEVLALDQAQRSVAVIVRIPQFPEKAIVHAPLSYIIGDVDGKNPDDLGPDILTELDRRALVVIAPYVAQDRLSASSVLVQRVNGTPVAYYPPGKEAEAVAVLAGENQAVS